MAPRRSEVASRGGPPARVVSVPNVRDVNRCRPSCGVVGRRSTPGPRLSLSSVPVLRSAVLLGAAVCRRRSLSVPVCRCSCWPLQRPPGRPAVLLMKTHCSADGRSTAAAAGSVIIYRLCQGDGMPTAPCRASRRPRLSPSLPHQRQQPVVPPRLHLLRPPSFSFRPVPSPPCPCPSQTGPRRPDMIGVAGQLAAAPTTAARAAAGQAAHTADR